MKGCVYVNVCVVVLQILVWGAVCVSELNDLLCGVELFDVHGRADRPVC